MKEILCVIGFCFGFLLVHYLNAKTVIKYFNLSTDISCAIIDKIAFVVNKLSRVLALCGLGYFDKAMNELKKWRK